MVAATENLESSPESEDWVLRRTPKACRLCRKKKVRCDGGQPTCAQCLVHKSECIYLPRAQRAKRSHKERKNSSSQQPRNRNDSVCSPSIATTSAGLPSSAISWNRTITSSVNNQKPPTPPGFATENAAFAVQKPPTPPDAAAGVTRSIAGDVDAIADTINCASDHGVLDHRDPIDQANQDMSPNIFEVSQNGQSIAGPYHPHGGPDLTSALDYHDAQYYGTSPSISLLNCALLSVNEDFPTLIDPNLQSAEIPGEVNVGSDGADAANGSMDIDDLSMDANENMDLEEEDIGHSLQSTLVGHMKYMGPSMSFIPATRLGQEWITRVTGSSYFSNQLQTFLREWTPVNSASDMHVSYDYTAMPSYESALNFVHCYFATVQSAFPILDEKAFIDHLETSYSTLMPSDDPTWCALVNVVLAIGCRATPGASDATYCALFNNALGLFTSVSLGWAKLEKVQTLILMYIFGSHTTSAHWGYTFLSCAVSESYAMGLHVQTCKSWSLSDAEVKRRSLLFWTLFCLDAQLIFRLGRPPLIRRQEISQALPSKEILDTGFSTQPYHHPTTGLDASWWGNMFIKNIETSHLLLDVHDFACVKPEMPSLDHRLSKLEAKIARAHSNLESEGVFRPGIHAMPNLGRIQGTILPVAIVQSSVFLAKWVLRLRPIGLKTVQQLQQLRLDVVDLPREPSPSLAEDLDIAAEAAGSLIELVSSLTKDHENFYWYLAPLPVFGLYVLFMSILHQPLGPKANQYMELMSMVVESTVQGANMPRSLISDLHLTHWLAFFSRTARMSLSRAKNAQNQQNTNGGGPVQPGRLRLDGTRTTP